MPGEWGWAWQEGLHETGEVGGGDEIVNIFVLLDKGFKVDPGLYVNYKVVPSIIFQTRTLEGKGGFLSFEYTSCIRNATVCYCHLSVKGTPGQPGGKAILVMGVVGRGELPFGM